MRVRIAIHDPTDGSVKEVEFSQSPVRIGRRAGNDLVLRHGFVSDPHALLEFDEAGVRVVDLGSRNGTMVRGKALAKNEPCPVEGVAQVDIGPFMLILTASSGDAQPISGPLPPTMPLVSMPDAVTTGSPVPAWVPEPRDLLLPTPQLPIVIGLERPLPRVTEARPQVPVVDWAERPDELNAPTEPQDGPLQGIVEESFEEAVFLWRLWEDGLGSHARDLGRLSSFVEERLQGALDGVRAGGQAAFETLVAPALASDEHWPLAVAAHVAVTGGAGKEALLGMIGAAEGQRLDALRRGVELAASDEETAVVERSLSQGGVLQRAALVTLRAFRRRPPGPELTELLRDQTASVRACALGAARYQPGGVLPMVDFALGDPDSEVVVAAVETGLVLGSRAAWVRCRELARSPGAGADRILLLVAALGAGRDPELVLAALALEPTRRAALRALGSLGTVQAADACLEAMGLEENARLAAEAFCTITGLDLHAENLIAPDSPEPDDIEAAPLDGRLVPGPDDELPLPDVVGIRRWWERARVRFAKGGRFYQGRPVSLGVLQEALETASMRRRRAVALELAIRTGGRYDVETRAFVLDQRRQMQGFAAVKDGRSQPAALAGLISRI